MDLIKSGASEKFHTLALDYAYNDQAHFINDFKRLIGESPVRSLNGKFAYLKSYLGSNRT